MSDQQLVEITLNEKKLLVSPRQTILEVSEEQGIEIPTLCHDPRLEPYASCWMCIVKVSGAKGFVPACSTKVRQGMHITTDDEDIHATRRMALELLLSNHYGDCRPPCSLTCPSNIDVQGYVGLIANRRYREALQLIKRDNPFPAAIGRVCPRPCEDACRRNLVDEPVAIDWLKRFVADRDLFSADGYDPPLAAGMGRSVAVVGAGPAGLSAAYYLVQEGVEVTIYEAEAKAGGMLRYGIPDYRLPQDTLDLEIETILRLGVQLKTGLRIGKDVQLEELRQRYDAVVLTSGAWKSRGLRVEGEDKPGVIAGIDFLHGVALGERPDLGQTVAVVGGGNTAIDSARTAVRLGAAEVNLYYRRSDVEMPASPIEVEEAIEEGVHFYYLVAPLMIGQKGNGQKSLRLIKMELGEPDSSGRRRPIPIEGSDFEVQVDTIITAIGQYADTGFLESFDGLLNEKGYLICDASTGHTPIVGLFAAGDLVTGPDIAIRAIAGGKHAARAALAHLRGERYSIDEEFLSKKENFGELTEDDYRDETRIPRRKMKTVSPAKRTSTFGEIEKGYTEKQAVEEAVRCMECGCQDVEECKLKRYAQDYGASQIRYAGEIQRHPIDETHPYITRDPAKCVLCGRCIRICQEVQGLGVLGYVNRGFQSLVVPTFSMPFGEDSRCISCGQCVSACPVGALTEKNPAGKTVPLKETVEQGYCSLCSVGCPLELRYHGSLLTRVTSRFDNGSDGGAPFGGRLCARGRFEHAFLNTPVPSLPVDKRGEEIDRQEAARLLEKAVEESRRPLMRLSPYLPGEVLDRFLSFARSRGLPVQAAGLEGLETGWSELLENHGAGKAHYLFEDRQNQDSRSLLVLVGNLEQSNNVAFTECLAAGRQWGTALWYVGELQPEYRRFFDRTFSKIDDLPKVLEEAAGKRGTRADILLNPEEILAGKGKRTEKKVLKALLARDEERIGVTLFWSSRNAAYLLRLLRSLPSLKDKAAGGSAGTDLLLEAGPPPGFHESVEPSDREESSQEPAESIRIIRWGFEAGEAELFIPLDRSLLFSGYSEPSGRRPRRVGQPAREAMKNLIIV